MNDGLLKYHKYNDLLRLFELDRLSLDDIWDEDWFFIQTIVQEKEKYKIQKAEEAERISRLLGDKDKNKKPF